MENKDYTWVTFDGKEAKLSTVDHQHLSNCYWFAKIFAPGRDEGRFFMEKCKKAAYERFNGHLLPYRPHLAFVQEIRELEERDMLRNFPDNPHFKSIVLDGEVIGEIRLHY